MKKRDLYYRQKELDQEEEEEEEKQLLMQNQPRRNLEQYVGRKVVESVSGNRDGPLHNVPVSDIMKSFRCKDDFIRILTIDGTFKRSILLNTHLFCLLFL
jgi:hypothetical protein